MIQFDEKQKNRLFYNRFYIKKRISSGSFGVVFLCQDLQTKEYVAMKVEKDDTGNCMSVDREVQMLEDLKKVPGVPKLLWAGKEHGHNCVVLQLLGRDLSYHLKALKRFSLKCIVNIGMQLLQIIEGVHRKGIVHRDLKPENVMTGRDQEQNNVYLADFGISKYYRESDGSHIQLKEGKPFVGTTRYASIGSHKGYELSRRDDLESLGYMLIYMYKGTLPWQTVHHVTEKEKTRLVGQIKMRLTLEELCSDSPVEFIQYFQYVRDLKFKSTPDYRYMFSLFEQISVQYGFKQDKRLDWTDYMAATTKITQDNTWVETRVSKKPEKSEICSQQSSDLLKLPSMKSQKRNRSRHQSESQKSQKESDGSSNQNSNQSSIHINYQNSQFSSQNVRLNSSKLLSKLQLQERDRGDRGHSRHLDSSIVNSQKSLISEKKFSVQQNSQFINQFVQEDFQDLEELEARLEQDQHAKNRKNKKSLQVKEIHESRNPVNEYTNMTGLTNFDDDCGIENKLEKLNQFQTKFKERLAKY